MPHCLDHSNSFWTSISVPLAKTSHWSKLDINKVIKCIVCGLLGKMVVCRTVIQDSTGLLRVIKSSRTWLQSLRLSLAQVWIIFDRNAPLFHWYHSCFASEESGNQGSEGTWLLVCVWTRNGAWALQACWVVNSSFIFQVQALRTRSASSHHK